MYCCYKLIQPIIFNQAQLAGRGNNIILELRPGIHLT
jgi:hypothetical protein